MNKWVVLLCVLRTDYVTLFWSWFSSRSMTWCQRPLPSPHSLYLYSNVEVCRG